MRVIGRKAVHDFARKHADAAAALDAWWRITRGAEWASLAEVHLTYPHADAVKGFTVFNVKGNKYRLITRIDYVTQLIFIKRVLTHSEYSKGSWKNG